MNTAYLRVEIQEGCIDCVVSYIDKFHKLFCNALGEECPECGIHEKCPILKSIIVCNEVKCVFNEKEKCIKKNIIIIDGQCDCWESPIIDC